MSSPLVRYRVNDSFTHMGIPERKDLQHFRLYQWALGISGSFVQNAACRHNRLGSMEQTQLVPLESHVALFLPAADHLLLIQSPSRIRAPGGRPPGTNGSPDNESAGRHPPSPMPSM